MNNLTPPSNTLSYASLSLFAIGGITAAIFGWGEVFGVVENRTIFFGKGGSPLGSSDRLMQGAVVIIIAGGILAGLHKRGRSALPDPAFRKLLTGATIGWMLFGGASLASGLFSDVANVQSNHEARQP